MSRQTQRALYFFLAAAGAWCLTGCSAFHQKEVRLRQAVPERQGVALEFSDTRSDGTPDFLRLEDSADREAFRRWFTFLAEIQYFTPPSQRPAEITDCAALLRYAYREALRLHDANWSAASQLVLVPALESVRKYNYPHTPLGPALFRVRPGPWSPADLHGQAFGQFADAEALQRWNTFFISREIGHAQPGDLLFYRRTADQPSFHSMILLGRSQVTSGITPYVVYDTGPEGTKTGEIRRLSVDQLLHFPDPEWQPGPANPAFLGVFRWNILNTGS
ncbi:MAG TPA: DUF1175 family protein [Bryobacteraceae bacterium]